MRSIRRIGVALTATVLLAGPASAADRIKVFVDQDTSGPGGTDAVSIAMLLLARNVDVVGIGVVAGDAWERPYSRSRAAFPAGTAGAKFWPAVSRIDNAYGDRNFVCACPPMEAYD